MDEEQAIRFCTRKPYVMHKEELIDKFINKLDTLEESLNEVKKTFVLLGQSAKKSGEGSGM